MILVIIALIVFGIASVSITVQAFKKKTLIWIITSVVFIVTWIIAIGWALTQFSN